MAEEQKNINLVKYYNIIENNQGIYNDDEYQKILKYVEEIKTKLNNQTKEFYKKDKYTIVDYYKFSKYYNVNLNENLFDNNIYEILLKYDLNKINNMIMYYRKIDFINDGINSLDDFIYDSYKYNSNIRLNRIMSISIILYCEYTKEEKLLKDIIEVGDMYE